MIKLLLYYHATCRVVVDEIHKTWHATRVIGKVQGGFFPYESISLQGFSPVFFFYLLFFIFLFPFHSVIFPQKCCKFLNTRLVQDKRVIKYLLGTRGKYCLILIMSVYTMGLWRH